jgi:hypothetical protein
MSPPPAQAIELVVPHARRLRRELLGNVCQNLLALREPHVVVIERDAPGPHAVVERDGFRSSGPS